MIRALVPLAIAGVSILACGQRFTPTAALGGADYIPARITQPVDDHQRVTLRGNTHPLARPQFDAGAAPPDLPMDRMLLVLKRSPEQQAALAHLLDSQQDKSSANYHQWLSPDQFGEQFGPADADLQMVSSWLQSHGFRIGKIAKGRNIIEFSGSAAQVQETFSTPIHQYAVNGKQHWANAADPQIPAALAPVVDGVFTLHNFRKKPMLKLSARPVSAKYVKGQPLATFGNPAIHALAPADYAKIYNINPVYSNGVNGVGRGIAVVARTNLYGGGSDLGDFQTIFGLCCSFYSIVLNGPDPGDLGGGDEAEATLDATWASALAPGAGVTLVVSASTNSTDGVDLSELYIIDNNFADIMTESFGTCEMQQGIGTTEAAAISALAEQAAAQGITYVVASGDSGAEGCDNPNSPFGSGIVSVNVLGSTPFNIAVGGTMFNEHGQDSKYWNSANDTNFGSALSYIPEMVWNESCTVPQCGQNAGLWATGGGASVYFHKPSWQTGFGDSMRDVPDVSLTAAGHDPYLLCLEGSCVPDAQGRFSIWLVSGTSAAAPSFAGIMALVDQKMGARQGQANYVLYRLAASNPGTCNGSSTTTLPTSNCIFNDTTVGNNAVPGESGYNTTAGKYQSGKGYDLATGLGSMNVANLVSKWNTVTFNPTNTTLVLNSGAAVNVPHGTLIDYAITVAPQSGTGTPTGDVALMQSTPWSRAIALSTLTGGAASGQTNRLPGGNYYMGAHYSGDKTFAASDSGSSFVMIRPETSHTALQVGGGFDGSGNIVPFPGAPYGSFMYLRADVGGSSGVGVPSGYVMFTDNGSPIGTYSLNSQGNTTTPDGFFSIPAGTHSLGAQYSSDPSFASSTSTPVSVTVTQAGSSGSVGYAGAAKGANLTATIATNSGGNPPTGTVTFSVDGSPVASPVAVSGRDAVLNPFLAILFGTAPPVRLGAQAAGSLLDSALPNGPHTVVATYNGDANYAASTSAPFAFNLQPDFVLNSSGNSISISAPGATGSLNVAISQLDNFTGTVTFACSGLPLESTCTFSPASIKGSGQTVVTVKTTAPKSSRLNSPPLWPLGLGATGVGIAGIFCLGVPVNRRWRHNLFGVVLFTLVMGAIGCGGGSGGSGGQHDPGTGTGTYTVTVTATSGALRHQVSFRMVVQ